MDWVNTNDLKSEWDAEPACAGYKYLENTDYFKGEACSSLHYCFASIADDSCYCQVDVISAAEAVPPVPPPAVLSVLIHHIVSHLLTYLVCVS